MAAAIGNDTAKRTGESSELGLGKGNTRSVSTSRIRNIIDQALQAIRECYLLMKLAVFDWWDIPRKLTEEEFKMFETIAHNIETASKKKDDDSYVDDSYANDFDTRRRALKSALLTLKLHENRLCKNVLCAVDATFKALMDLKKAEEELDAKEKEDSVQQEVIEKLELKVKKAIVLVNASIVLIYTSIDESKGKILHLNGSKHRREVLHIHPQINKASNDDLDRIDGEIDAIEKSFNRGKKEKTGKDELVLARQKIALFAQEVGYLTANLANEKMLGR